MRNYISYLRHLSVFACMSLLAACTTSGDILTGHPVATSTPSGTDTSTAQVVFFHDGQVDTEPAQANALVLSTQGNVISGLHPQQYTVIPVCTGSQTFQITRGTLSATSIELTITPNTVHYVRLMPDARNAVVNYSASAHNSIDDVVDNTNARSFLVPRHTPNCTTPEQPTTFNFDSEALFAFDGAELIDVVTGHPLDEVVAFIEAHEMHGLRVTVSGYTDHLGARDYNQKLSEQRAQTVANYLKSKGYDGRLQVFGFGAADPVVTDCDASLTRDALIQCLQPNRRVTVNVWQDSSL